MKISIDVLSGMGRKTAAAILLTFSTSGRGRSVRFLLDAGGALEAGENKGWEMPANLDAIFISHDHEDHMGALREMVQQETLSQVPVYATLAVQKQLPSGLNYKILPVSGAITVAGVTVTTGSAGHSFGGVWLHFNIGNGIFYSGDFSMESTLYAFTTPPEAEIALLDASYGLYDETLEQCKRKLKTFLTQEKALLMPVPQTGRALEIACWLSSMGYHNWSLAADCISPENALSGSKEGICDAMIPVLSSLSRKPFDVSAKVILCGDPDGMSGEASELLAQPERYIPIYTGHLPEHAQYSVKKGDAFFVRWNVHPRQRDLKKLIDQLQCQLCLPLFQAIKDLSVWQKALGNCITTASYLEGYYEGIDKAENSQKQPQISQEVDRGYSVSKKKNGRHKALQLHLKEMII
ncbi:MBL fold metallo-hydrolase [Marinomonas algicola]|uniref:MBL fold metallo-hydrolase n=1 Tax=Marinomonas algicola TaxID=2773454 RepID=UPI0017489228|nr:MBL fold metallo-hydrolase [Marinomonas algicola]